MFGSRFLRRLSLWIIFLIIAPAELNLAIPQARAAVPNLSVNIPINFVLPNFQSGVSAEYLLSGYSVEGESTKDYLVGVSLNGGSSGDYLKFTSSSGLTLSYGFAAGTFDSFTEVTFTGNIGAINSALTTNFKYYSNSGTWPVSAPNIKITITENIPGIAYYAKDDHFYKVGHFMSTAGSSPSESQRNFVYCSDVADTGYESAYAPIETLTVEPKGDSSCTWSEANRLAKNSTLKGRPGYLANITSAEENAFLQNKLQGALNVWMGGTDGAHNGNSETTVATSLTSTPFDYMSDETLTAYSGGTEGLWHFYDGPEAGQIFWRYTGVYSCGGYNQGNVNTQSRWIDFQSRCELAGYNIQGGVESENYQMRSFSNWATYEPNNSSSNGFGEDNLVFNWNSFNGEWNDLLGDEPTVAFYGYLIEYGDSIPFNGVSKATSNLFKELTISFDANGGSGSMNALTTRGESNTVLSANTFTRTNYNFDGWSDTPGGPAAYADSDVVLFSANKTLYARWISTLPPSGGNAVAQPTASLPGITWNPYPLKAGEPVSEKHLNAKFSVPGKVSYSIPLGTKLSEGIFTVKITFIPDDTNKYLILEKTETLEVLPTDEISTITEGAGSQDPKSINTKNLPLLGKIYFNNNEFFLDSADRKTLKNIALMAKASNYKSILIFGNTDIKKGVDNTWLSRERTKAVSAYLKQFSLNVSWTRAWFGPTRPVVKGKDKASLALNRRVEIYLLR